MRKRKLQISFRIHPPSTLSRKKGGNFFYFHLLAKGRREEFRERKKRKYFLSPFFPPACLSREKLRDLGRQVKRREGRKWAKEAAARVTWRGEKVAVAARAIDYHKHKQKKCKQVFQTFLT